MSDPKSFPVKKCREGLFTPEGMGYTCELPMYHVGPHMNYSSKTHVEARERWEKANPELADKIEDNDIIL